MNILFSSCGRRVELLRLFREAISVAGGGKIVATDMQPLAAALNVADVGYLVPSCGEDGFLHKIMEICEKESVKAVFPLIDTELMVFARARELFGSRDIEVVVSDPRVIEICEDKAKTAEFFQLAGFPHLKTRALEEDLDFDEFSFPAFLKPRFGSGSKDTFVVNDDREFRVLAKKVREPLLQEIARGMEITADCLVDLEGRPLRIITRERLETRAGESSKGRTFKDKELTDLIARMLLKLRARGPITVQCFREDKGYVLSEINPRFGGGYPLAHAAGADFPRLLLDILSGESVSGKIDQYEEDMFMTRYDQSFFIRGLRNLQWNA